MPCLGGKPGCWPKAAQTRGLNTGWPGQGEAPDPALPSCIGNRAPRRRVLLAGAQLCCSPCPGLAHPAAAGPRPPPGPLHSPARGPRLRLHARPALRPLGRGELSSPPAQGSWVSLCCSLAGGPLRTGHGTHTWPERSLGPGGEQGAAAGHWLAVQRAVTAAVHRTPQPHLGHCPMWERDRPWASCTSSQGRPQPWGCGGSSP